MEIGHFYFLSNQYFTDFDDGKLMGNHEINNGVSHDRPCFCCLEVQNSNIYWCVPISSQINKYKKIYSKKIQKYNKCDTIEFGNVLGVEKAFLIQNMCPITEEYVKNEYLFNGEAVTIDYDTQNRIKRKVIKVLNLIKKGNTNLVFPNVLDIEKELENNININ